MTRLGLKPWPDEEDPTQTNGSYHHRNKPFVYTNCTPEGKHLFVTLGKVRRLPTIEELPPMKRVQAACGGEVFTAEQIKPYAIRDHAAEALKDRFNKLGVRVEERKGWEIPADEEMLNAEIERLLR